MNPKLIQFIELCLVDGVISDKEREIIFRKSKEYGVPEDECEIILEGMIQKLGKKESFDKNLINTEQTQETTQEKSSSNNVKSESNQSKEKSDSHSKNTVQYKKINNKTWKWEYNDFYDYTFDHKHDHSYELLDQIETFLREYPYTSEPYDFLYDENRGVYKRFFDLNEFIPKFQTEGKWSHFCCEFFIENYGGVNLRTFYDFNIKFKGQVKEMEIEEKDSLFGTKQYYKERIKYFYILFYPFCIDEDHVPDDHHNSYMKQVFDKDEFLHSIREHVSKEKLDNPDIDQIIPVLEFVNDIIFSYYNKYSEELDNLTLELSKLDTDNNGIIDVIEGDTFSKLFSKHQNFIKDVDKTYIQHFVKLSNFIRHREENLQQLFNSINESDNRNEQLNLYQILRDSIHTYESIMFHSLNMVLSIVEGDLKVFYEIYEIFDKLNLFNSNWEKQVNEKMENIEKGLETMTSQIRLMDKNISKRLDSLTYITQESFINLERSVSRELNSINSSVNFNNLLTGIQTYQIYKINKNTKSLRG